MEIQKLEVLETLVDELLKEQPQEIVVKKCMKNAGLPDSHDPIDRINQVLTALQFAERETEFTK